MQLVEESCTYVCVSTYLERPLTILRDPLDFYIAWCLRAVSMDRPSGLLTVQ